MMHPSWYLAALLSSASLLQAHAQQPAPAAAPSVTVAGQRHASEWFRVESQHFIVYSDTSNDDVALLLNQLEKLDQMLRVYTKPFLKATGNEPKLTFYYHDSANDLDGLAANQPADAIGLYTSCTAAVQGFGVQLNKLERPDKLVKPKAEQSESLGYLFEAYTRHFIYRYTDIRAPTSFIDGLAQYFASARFSDAQMLVGRTPLNVNRYLSFLDQGNPYYLDYKDVLEQNDSRAIGNMSQAGIKLEFAARSWLLTHYMLSSDDNRNKLVTYLAAVYRDTPIPQAFEQAYGIKTGDLGKEMWRYRNTSVKVLQVDVPELTPAVMEFKSLPQSSGEFVLAESALKSCPTRPAGEALLRQTARAAANYPSNDYAQLVLSRAQIDWGNPQDALPYLSAAAKKPGASAEVLYLLGQTQLRLSQLDAARNSLGQSLNLDPKSAEAAYALYQAGLQSGQPPDDDTLAAAIVAFNNGHEVTTLARSAALAYAYAGDKARARNALKLMAHNIREPELSAWAKIWLGKLAAGVGKDALLAEMRVQPAAGTVFREWTIATATVMQDIERNAGLQKARSYLDQQSVNPANPDRALQSTFGGSR
ncbi:tetratricopeptide repeat protein [Duganella sp. FT109W]|uniref:Tetratricopeptide repeat protein n=1 Tax=Duganella margarita TaxID=2692170 RepID=A0ABW9WJF2_9BURK|nr:tetratricopeptide repeat protein [Duganella margarita]MYN41016.1 tetratricopeptide repeat protein [Duganella margarita]